MRLHHQEPDGDRFLPHHHYLGLALALFGAAFSGDLWSMGALIGVGVGLYAFALLWHGEYATLGAAASILSGGIVTVTGVYGVVQGGGILPIVVVIGGLVALDDTIQHATGWWMPLDWLWKTHLRAWL